MSLTGLSNQVLLLTALVMVVVGAVACFAGYRIFRWLLILQGFVAGVILGLSIANGLPLTPDQLALARLILAGGVGLIGASLAVLLFAIAVFLSGAGFGVLIASALTPNSNDTTHLVLVLVLALVGGVVALAFQKLFIVLSTSFGGSLLMTSGAYRFLSGGATNGDLLMNPALLFRPGASQTLGALYFLLLILWLLLGVVGVLVQYRILHEGRRRVMI